MPFTVINIPRTFTSTTLFPGPAEMRVLSSPSPQNPVCLCLSWPKEVLVCAGLTWVSRGSQHRGVTLWLMGHDPFPALHTANTKSHEGTGAASPSPSLPAALPCSDPISKCVPPQRLPLPCSLKQQQPRQAFPFLLLPGGRPWRLPSSSAILLRHGLAASLGWGPGGGGERKPHPGTHKPPWALRLHAGRRPRGKGRRPPTCQ